MTKYDEMLDRLIMQMSNLSRPGLAAFFSVASESLFPLYERFFISEKWGNLSVVRDALDVAIECAVAGEGVPNAGMLRELEKVTPHGDDFDSPWSTYAQDVVICIDTALRFLMGEADAQIGCVEFVLEPLRTAIAIEQLGCVDPGSSPDELDWFENLPNDPRMRRALEFLEAVIGALINKTLTTNLIKSLGGEGRVILYPF